MRTRVIACAWVAISVSVVGSACAYVGGVNMTPEVSLQMHEFFEDMVNIRRALVLGELEGVRPPANRLATHPAHPDLPGRSLAHFEELQTHATTVASATSRGEAAQAASRLALTCGNCHQENDVGPRFVIGQPPSRPNLTTHMVRHQWALNRFWQALIAPADAPWTAGSDILETTQISPDEFGRRGLDPEDSAQIFAELQEIGQRARTVSEPDERAAILAELWMTCGDCHQNAGVRRR